VKEILFVLRRAAEGEGLRISPRGNLNLSFVGEFWEKLVRGNAENLPRPQVEDECLELVRAHVILEDGGLVHTVGGHLVPTPHGRDMLSRKNLPRLFYELVRNAGERWNWASADRYPTFEFLQDAVWSLIEELDEWPQPTITPRQLFDQFFEVPQPSVPFAPEDGEAPPPAGDWAAEALHSRFFDRFCVPFGLLKPQPGEPSLLFSIDRPYELTPFLREDFPSLMGMRVVPRA
jgi:hypothetical protein